MEYDQTLEQQIYGVSTVLVESHERITCYYFQGLRAYKRLAGIYLSLLVLGLGARLYCLSGILSSSLLLQGTALVDACLLMLLVGVSVFELRWPHQNALLRYLLCLLGVCLVQLLMSRSLRHMLQSAHSLCLMVLMYFIGRMVTRIDIMAQQLRPEEGNKSNRYTL